MMNQKSFFSLVIVALCMSAGIAHGQASGSGFFITQDGYFVTNQHVVESAKRIFIRAANGKKYPAEVVRLDSANDIAILKTEGTFRALPVQSSQGVRRGDKVFTLGFPNTSVQGVEPKFTDGVISSLTGVRDEPNNFQISVAIQPGNSGGPLISNHGNVVGIVASKLSAEVMLRRGGTSPENVNYAVKSNYLLELASTLPNVKAGMLPARSKASADMSDLAVFAEGAIGLVSVELLPEKKSSNSQAEPPQQSPGAAMTPPGSASQNISISPNFPDRPIRIVIPFPPGGTTDFMGRTFAKNAAQTIGKSFIIENKPGGGGAFGADAVQRAAADGYTLLLTNESLALLPSVLSSPTFNFERGFNSVSMLSASPLVLVVNASIQANNINELVALAKNSPGQLRYASTGNGSLGQFAGEEFRSATGTNIFHVPYKGMGPALQDLLAGNVNLMFGNIEILLPHIRNGKLRAIAVTSSRRASEIPEIPTLIESGISAAPIQSWLAIVAPPDTPLDVVNKLNQIVVRTLSSPDFKTNARAATPEVTTNFIKSETGKFRKLANTHGIRAD